MFLTQAILNNGFPFEIKINDPNANPYTAMTEEELLLILQTARIYSLALIYAFGGCSAVGAYAENVIGAQYKLEKSRKHAGQGKSRNADHVISDMREKYGL